MERLKGDEARNCDFKIAPKVDLRFDKDPPSSEATAPAIVRTNEGIYQH
jgi:hypothetical protein